jgi:RND family efflux transporter MFP subunit
MKKYGILLTLFLVLGTLFYNKIFIPKHTFNTQIAKVGTIDIDINGIGNLGARHIYKIGTIYGGQILNFNVHEGDFVKKGTLLATIDTIDIPDKLNELKATKNKIINDIISLKADSKSAQAAYKYQLEVFKKNKKLYQKHAISELDFIKYKTNKDQSKYTISSIDAKLASLNNQLTQIKSSISGLEKRLTKYEIYSPVNGYITKKLVTNFQITMPNQSIVEIVNPDDVWIKTYIDTRISGNVTIGNKATIILQSSTKVYTGTVSSIKPITNSITYEREVDVSFDKLPIPFYLDEQASVKIKISSLNNIIKIPNNALCTYNSKQGVWILTDDNKVKFKPIKILANDDYFSATNDILANTKIVIPNPKNKTLTNGMKIYPKGK